jgi:gamma-tubulin complex component 5
LTWKDILSEEPFEGEHWEGILDRPGEEREWDSTPSLSPLSSDQEDDDSVSSLSERRGILLRNASREAECRIEGTGEYPADEKITLGSNVPPHTHTHRKEFEELRKIQYWRKDWNGFSQPSKRFDIGDPSTLGGCSPFTKKKEDLTM